MGIPFIPPSALLRFNIETSESPISGKAVLIKLKANSFFTGSLVFIWINLFSWAKFKVSTGWLWIKSNASTGVVTIDNPSEWTILFTKRSNEIFPFNCLITDSNFLTSIGNWSFGVFILEEEGTSIPFPFPNINFIGFFSLAILRVASVIAFWRPVSVASFCGVVLSFLPPSSSTSVGLTSSKSIGFPVFWSAGKSIEPFTEETNSFSLNFILSFPTSNKILSSLSSLISTNWETIPGFSSNIECPNLTPKSFISVSSTFKSPRTPRCSPLSLKYISLDSVKDNIPFNSDNSNTLAKMSAGLISPSKSKLFLDLLLMFCLFFNCFST